MIDHINSNNTIQNIQLPLYGISELCPDNKTVCYIKYRSGKYTKYQFWTDESISSSARCLKMQDRTIPSSRNRVPDRCVDLVLDEYIVQQ